MRQIDLAKEEEKILKFWEENKIFEKSLEATKKGKPFVFFEGPPTANAKPGIHHVLARAFKDIILRYQTMRGRFISRRAGWDTHGLPVEIEIEKKLGLKSKKDIEKYGVAKFNRQCQESVWQYKEEWEKLTKRMGFWLDLKNYYATYQPQYIESLWAILKKIWQKNLLVKDYKVVPLCLRCGTPVSFHEVAQGYETVTDKAVTVKFLIKGTKNKYLLAWTTTLWTLPGNVALAVGSKIIYQEVTIGQEHFILAKDLVAKIFSGQNYQIIKDIKASELTKLAYEPLFKVKELISDKSYRVYMADFVNTQEGTGIVHTAVMYGIDDFELGSKIGLPKFHTVNLEGEFVKSVPVVGGLRIIQDKAKDAMTEKAIMYFLQKKNLLFKEEPYIHEYPFCWRCKTPLLYYARDSWFIKMSALRQKLIANNQKINWIPAHLKAGRFGEWLKDVKDWALSRERYWGTPLPIWACSKCSHQEIIGSLQELNEKRFKKTTNFILMRHGQALSNVKAMISSYPEQKINPLTSLGQKQCLATAKKLKNKKIDLIFSSDILRCRESAQIVADTLNIKQVNYDSRLREIDFGAFNGKTVQEYHDFFNTFKERFSKPIPEGESWLDVYKRVKDFINELNQKYSGKTILIVSHMDPLFLIASWNGIFGEEELEKLYQFNFKNLKNALKEAKFKLFQLNNWPHDEDGDLNLHRPFIDQIYLKCSKCAHKMERVKDLIDVWFDSGAMPFASVHYPFTLAQSQKSKVKSQKLGKSLYPADYICEAIDQTRGWFYTLLAVSTLLDQGAPYKNVISLNHILDDKGEKMSKSKGNIVDPLMVGEKVGFDALRWYFYSVNSPGDNKLFNLKDIEIKQRRFISTLVNSWLFLETYFAVAPKQFKAQPDILDKWILSRLENTRQFVSKALAGYDITFASRALEDFVDDLSNWYIRRSRQKFQKEGIDRKKAVAQETLITIFGELAKLLAPFIPFTADWLYQNLKKVAPNKFSKISVHLEKWPIKSIIKKEDNFEKVMHQARSMVAIGLAERARAGIKVRQPLEALHISASDNSAVKDVINIVKEELNVKKVAVDKTLTAGTVRLDTHLSLALKEEGLTRELIRYVNDMRKEAHLVPTDEIIIFYNIRFGDNFKNFLVKWEQNIKQETRAKEIHFSLSESEFNHLLMEKNWQEGGFNINLGIKKVT